MKLHARILLVTSAALLIVGLLPGPTACAQQAGHYIGGATGLENGTGAPPGFYATYFPLVERVDALKGPDGATLASPNINVVANMVAYAATMQKKILGAEYGLSVIIPVVNTRFTANLFNASAESAGLSDIYFAPVVLGWEKGNANYKLNYGFYAPSGQFDPSLPLNPGLGFGSIRYRPGQRTRLASQNSGTPLSSPHGRSTTARRISPLSPARCSQANIALVGVLISTR